MSDPLVFAISPKYTTLDFPDGLTLDNKIDIFADRIIGWQIGIAKKIIQYEIQHSGYALLQILFSYFEMLGKYRSGYVGNFKSRINFHKGVKATFLEEIGAEEEIFLTTLYKSVRNGLYHLGMTKINVILRCDIPGSISFNSENKTLTICPDHLVNDIDIRFQDYVTELRNSKNIELRNNFESRFDFDNSEASL
ncbi:MAG: hypothetical protein ABIJ65_07970 [Chloroflexota bacterium]